MKDNEYWNKELERLQSIDTTDWNEDEIYGLEMQIQYAIEKIREANGVE